jgi:excisionase family DNA binding protein
MAAYAANDQGARPTRLTIAEAAEALRCSERTVHRYIAVRRLDSARIGPGRVTVTRDSVERLLAQASR